MATDALDILQAAREAAIDAERAKNQLDATQPKNMPERIVERRNEHLKARIAEDERKVQEAVDILYGDIAKDLTETERDVLYHRYVMHSKWVVVGRVVGFSAKLCQIKHNQAIEKLNIA